MDDRVGDIMVNRHSEVVRIENTTYVLVCTQSSIAVEL